MRSTVLEDTWIDGVIHRPSLSHSVKECGQHPRPLPASPQPHRQQGKLVKSMPIKFGR